MHFQPRPKGVKKNLNKISAGQPSLVPQDGCPALPGVGGDWWENAGAIFLFIFFYSMWTSAPGCTPWS